MTTSRMTRLADFKWLAGDRRDPQVRLMARWLAQLPKVRRAFLGTVFPFDPLVYNETTAVGLLASTAGRLKLLALSDYMGWKRRAKPGSPHYWGRYDLWIGDAASTFSWSFEFKTLACREGSWDGTFETRLKQACADARAHLPSEADRRFGGVLITPAQDVVLTPGTIKRIDDHARSASVACRIGGGDALVWIVLKDVSR